LPELLLLWRPRTLVFCVSKARPKRRWVAPKLVGIAALVDRQSVIRAKSKHRATQRMPARIGRGGLGGHTHKDIGGRIDYWGKEEEGDHRNNGDSC